MMKNQLRFVFVITYALILSSCAFGNKTNYRGHYNFTPGFRIPEITVGAIDKRPYVLDHSFNPTYCGTVRSLAGIPYPVNTESGNPLSEDILWSLSETLKSYGVDVIQMPLISEISEKEAMTMLASKGNKSLLLTIFEWRSHVYMNPTLDYDLKLSAISKTGERIDDVRSKATLPFGPGQEVADLAKAVTKVFGELFNDPKVQTALLSGEDQQIQQVNKKLDKKEQVPEPSTKSKTPCTVQQILKMKEMGMSDQQISAACE